MSRKIETIQRGERIHRIPDPIHGNIRPPPWLIAIDTMTPVRRMTLIRQLGLKAYIDFPGAIHTRYSHAIGVMELAGRLVDLLALKLERDGKPNSVSNLRANRSTIMAAGFLHDVGHGPFSHAVDYPLKKLSKKTHEEISTDIIKEDLKELENHSIPIDSVNKIITNKHKFPFVSQIVNGPLDADKLDYLLRDSHHVGLKYALDIDNFVDNYTILGGDTELAKCELGLEDTLEATTSAEIFLTMWKGMYDLVYHIPNSRIAEKMLERAVLVACSENTVLHSIFANPKRIVELYDEKLLEMLQSVPGFPAETAVAILSKRGLFKNIYEEELTIGTFPQISEGFLEALGPADVSEASYELSERMSNELKIKSNEIICDIVKSRAPYSIHVNKNDAQGDPVELKSKSPIVFSMKEKIYLKAYIHPSLHKKFEETLLHSKIEGFVASW